MLGGGDGIAERRVHDDNAFGGSRLDIDVVDADAGAADHLEAARRGDDPLGRLSGGAHRQTVVITDDALELVLAETDLDVGVDTALAEDGDGGRGQLIGNQNAGHVGYPILSGQGGESHPGRERRRWPLAPGRGCEAAPSPAFTPPWRASVWPRQRPTRATASVPRRPPFPPSGRTRCANAAVRR